MVFDEPRESFLANGYAKRGNWFLNSQTPTQEKADDNPQVSLSKRIPPPHRHTQSIPRQRTLRHAIPLTLIATAPQPCVCMLLPSTMLLLTLRTVASSIPHLPAKPRPRSLSNPISLHHIDYPHFRAKTIGPPSLFLRHCPCSFSVSFSFPRPESSTPPVVAALPLLLAFGVRRLHGICRFMALNSAKMRPGVLLLLVISLLALLLPSPLLALLASTMVVLSLLLLLAMTPSSRGLLLGSGGTAAAETVVVVLVEVTTARVLGEAGMMGGEVEAASWARVWACMMLPVRIC